MATQDKVECTLHGCTCMFDTIKQMQQHKKYDQDEGHYYCHVCDFDFADWSAFNNHMSQWSGLDVFKKDEKQYTREKEDGTFWHLRERHGAKYGSSKFHKYYCAVCGQRFRSNAGRQAHTMQLHPVDQDIECPGCKQSFPRPSGLIMHLEEGHCRKITSDAFMGCLLQKQLVQKLLEKPSLMKDITEKDFFSYLAADDEAQNGGVSLFTDDDDEDIIINEIIEGDHGLSQAEQSLTSATACLSLGSSTIITSNADISQLASDNKSAPPSAAWMVRATAQAGENHGMNLLTSQWWNPMHKDYDENRFWDPIIERHRCPFPACFVYFQNLIECQDHINEKHRITGINCPSCGKRFQKYHAFLAHTESGTTCKLRYTARWGQFLDTISGGFLTSETVAHPDIPATDEQTAGYLKFSSCDPIGLSGEEGEDNTATVGKSR